MEKQEFNKLVRFLRHNQVRTVGIEAGHIYNDERPGQEHIQSFEIGVNLSGALTLEKIKPTGIIFIDDYNPEDNVLCLRDYLNLARGCGFFPRHSDIAEEVVMESEMVLDAKKIISELKQRSLVKNGEGAALFTTKYNVRLLHDDGRLSCPVLNTAFCRYRFPRHDFSVTILPSLSPYKYKREQRKVRQLLRLLDWKDIPLANIFFQPDGKFSVSLPK